MLYTYIYTYKVHQSTIKVESFLQQRNQEPMDLTNMALSPPLLGSAAAQFIPKVLQVFLMRACLVASNFLLHTSKPQKSTQQGCQSAHSILIEFIHIKGSRVVALNHHFQVCFRFIHPKKHLLPLPPIHSPKPPRSHRGGFWFQDPPLAPSTHGSSTPTAQHFATALFRHFVVPRLLPLQDLKFSCEFDERHFRMVSFLIGRLVEGEN